jgi:hypothetical protein
MQTRPVLFFDFDEALGFFQRNAHWDFDEDVLAHFHGGGGLGCVDLIGRGEHNGFDTVLRKAFFKIGRNVWNIPLFCKCLAIGFDATGEGDNFDVWEFFERARMVEPHGAFTCETDFHG